MNRHEASEQTMEDGDSDDSNCEKKEFASHDFMFPNMASIYVTRSLGALSPNFKLAVELWALLAWVTSSLGKGSISRGTEIVR